MARPIKWVLCQKDDHMKLHDDGQRVTVSQNGDGVVRLAYALGLPMESIDGWKIRLQWKEGIMQCHLCTRVICTLPLFCTLHRCVISSGSLPHSHITFLAYRLLFTVKTHFLLCFNNSVLQPKHNISTAFICIFIFHSHHAYYLSPCWSSNDRPYYSSLSHITPVLRPSPLPRLVFLRSYGAPACFIIQRRHRRQQQAWSRSSWVDQLQEWDEVRLWDRGLHSIHRKLSC